MTMERSISIAVIGYGIIGPAHVRAVLANPDLILAAIVDPIADGAAASAAKTHGVPHIQSVTQLLLSPATTPDAVIICTPNSTHAEVASQLAKAGVHMLIEKPLCTSTAEGAALIATLDEASKENGVKTIVGHHRRFNPYTVAAATAIRSGSLGRLLAVNGLWTTYKPADYFSGPAGAWRTAGATAGPVYINLIHDVDLLHFLVGSPVARVQSEVLASTREGHEAEAGAAITFKFRSGTVATFLLADNTPPPYSFEGGTGENPNIATTGMDFYRLFGTEASLSLPDMKRWSYDGGQRKSWSDPMTIETLPVNTNAVPFDLQIAHFVRVIRDQEGPICGPTAGLAALMVCEAVKRSLGTGEPVVLDEYKL